MAGTNERETAKKIFDDIGATAKKIARPLRFMEVCGTHTVSIFRAGIRNLLPETVSLSSGPGCPVCVTPDEYIDKAIAYAGRSDVIITTFGDMMKVPGSSSSLGEAKADGADVRIVYSPLDALNVAAENPEKKIVFLAVGFETTAPTAAATVLAAKERGAKNFFMLSAHKLVPPVLKLLITDPEVKVDGFILPGHVAVVTGTRAFRFVADEYGMSGVVAGFKPLEIARALWRLVHLVHDGEARIENEYESVVKPNGNQTSLNILRAVYEKTDATWRGIGEIPLSGLKMREEFSAYDIEKILPVSVKCVAKKTACRCGDVLKGIINPPDCPLFGKACVPVHAVGPCMVSSEGVCAAWHKHAKTI